MMVFGVLFTMTFGGVESIGAFINKVIGFLNAPAKNGYWYLMSLSVFYLSLAVYRLNKCQKWIVDVLIAIVIWCLFFLGWKYTAQTNDPFCLLNCGNFYPFFVLGVFSSKYRLIDQLMNRNWLLTLGLIGYVVLFSYQCPIHAIASGIKHVVLPLCALLVVVPMFVSRESNTSVVERALEYIGRNTLDIYVLHYFIITNINLVVVDRWLQESGNLILSVLIVLTVSLVVTYISIGFGKVLHSSRLIEKFVFGKS